MKFLKKPLLWLFPLLGGIGALVLELSRAPLESRPLPLESGSSSGVAPAELLVQLETLQSEKQASSAKIATLEAEVHLLKKELALQTHPAAPAGSPRQTPETRGTASHTDAPTESPFAAAVLDLALRAGRLNSQMQLHPELDIPELQYLDEGDWLHFAKEADLESEGGVRKALADLRQRAKDRFAPIAMQALSAFSKANGGQAPISVSQLLPYFPDSTDSALLERYNLLPANSPQQPASPSIGGPMILREKAVVDPLYDTGFDIGPIGWTSIGMGMGYVHKLK